MLRAFGITQTPEPLPGGAGRSWRAGGVVLKAVDDAEQAAWIAQTITDVISESVVLPRMTPTADGAWTVDGWTASEYVEAHVVPGRWHEIIEAGRAFHVLIENVPRPDWMDRTDDWWRRADQVAWNGRLAVGDQSLVVLVDRLRASCASVPLASQIIHADLCGNVLFDGHDRPVIIDFSPYWRPAEWASAIVAIDAFEWEGAGPGALEWLDGVAYGDQLLLRAAMFRIATSAEVAAAHGSNPAKYAVHRATVEALMQRLL